MKLSNDDKNTIIYAHRRNDKTMFRTLRYCLNNNGQPNNTNNYVIKIAYIKY